MPDPYAQKGLKHLRIPLARQLAVCAAQITQSEPSCMSCASTSIFDAPQSRDVPSKERVADAFRGSLQFIGASQVSTSTTC